MNFLNLFRLFSVTTVFFLGSGARPCFAKAAEFLPGLVEGGTRSPNEASPHPGALVALTEYFYIFTAPQGIL